MIEVSVDRDVATLAITYIWLDERYISALKTDTLPTKKTLKGFKKVTKKYILETSVSLRISKKD